MIFNSFNNEDEERDFGGHHFDSFYLFFRLGETEVEEPVAWRRLETRQRKKSEPMEQKKMPEGAEWTGLAKGWDNADRSEGERVRGSQENIFVEWKEYGFPLISKIRSETLTDGSMMAHLLLKVTQGASRGRIP